jgi:hypothetical protein
MILIYTTKGSSVQGHVIWGMCAERGQLRQFVIWSPTWKTGLAWTSEELCAFMWQRKVCPHLSDENIRPRTAHLYSKLRAKFQLRNSGPRAVQIWHQPIFTLRSLKEQFLGYSDDVKRAITWMTQQGGTSYASTCSSLSHTVTSASMSRVEKKVYQWHLNCVLLKSYLDTNTPSQIHYRPILIFPPSQARAFFQVFRLNLCGDFSHTSHPLYC